MTRRHSSFILLGVAALCVTGATAVFASAVAEGGKAGAQVVRGKPGSGVSVTPTVPAKIGIGETVTVRLRFAGISAEDGATVEVRDPATKATLLSTRLARGEQKTVELPYTGRSDGMQYLDITTTQAGRTSVQSVALPVGSGQIKLKPEGQRRTTASGETVISLPASSPGAGR